MAKAQDVFQNRIIGYATKPADQFQANALNYRKHPQRQRDAVNGSLRELGWIAAVIENVRTGNLVDGHERVWQALRNNEDVPYLQIDLTEEEERLALAIFDPITSMAETDAAILDELLQDVNTGEAALQELLATLAEDAGIVPPDYLLDTEYMPPESDNKGLTTFTFLIPDSNVDVVSEAIEKAKTIVKPSDDVQHIALCLIEICREYAST